MLTLLSFFILAKQPQLPEPHDRAWETGKEVLKEVSIPRGIVNGYRTMQWIYVVNEPLPYVVSRLKSKVPFQNKADEIDPSVLLRRGMAFSQRDVDGVTQKIALRKGTYAILKRVTGNTNTVETENPDYTVVTVTESVAPGKSPAKVWPAATQKKFAIPPMPTAVPAPYKSAPYAWNGYLTQKANRSQFLFVFKDTRTFAEVMASLDASLVVGLEWRKSDPPPAARYSPQEDNATLDFIEAAPAGALIADACAVSVYWTADSSTIGWEMPGYEYLFRKIE